MYGDYSIKHRRSTGEDVFWSVQWCGVEGEDVFQLIMSAGGECAPLASHFDNR